MSASTGERHRRAREELGKASHPCAIPKPGESRVQGGSDPRLRDEPPPKIHSTNGSHLHDLLHIMSLPGGRIGRRIAKEVTGTWDGGDVLAIIGLDEDAAGRIGGQRCDGESGTTTPPLRCHINEPKIAGGGTRVGWTRSKIAFVGRLELDLQSRVVRHTSG